MSGDLEPAVPSDADDVERQPCPRCLVEPGSPCRSRSGAVATTYHTGRFSKVPRLAKLLRVPVPADRGPGQPWRPGTPPPAPARRDVPAPVTNPSSGDGNVVAAVPRDSSSASPTVQKAADFVCEDDVRQAVRQGRKIVIGDHTIITPAARDLAEAYRIFVQASWPR